MRTTTLLFDLDDTLTVADRAADEAFLAAAECAQRKYALDSRAFAHEAERVARELWHDSPHFAWCDGIGISSWEGLCASFAGHGPELRALSGWVHAYRLDTWSRALSNRGVRDASLAEELSALFPRETLRRCVPFAEVEAELHDLKQRYTLGLLTNGAPDLQRSKIEGAQLPNVFDAVLISGEVGVGKPEPRIFEVAVEALDASVTETVMVGDNPSRDILGARRAGMRSVWINRDGQRLPDGAPLADAEITSLAELQGVLA